MFALLSTAEDMVHVWLELSLLFVVLYKGDTVYTKLNWLF